MVKDMFELFTTSRLTSSKSKFISLQKFKYSSLEVKLSFFDIQ